jgi:hypothetical protein
MAALQVAPIHTHGRPSDRTRARAPHAVLAHLHYQPSLRAHARERVITFARALLSVPNRDVGTITRVQHVHVGADHVPAHGPWHAHASVDGLLEHEGLLPRLQSAGGVPDTAPQQLHAAYMSPAQQAQRMLGGSHALCQKAKAGAVTLPHVDRDLKGRPMHTYLAVMQGVELVIAWRRGDLHEDEVLRHVPSLDVLGSRKARLAGLTVLRAVAGDLVHMPPDTVHMVVTEVDKVHLAFHMHDIADSSAGGCV